MNPFSTHSQDALETIAFIRTLLPACGLPVPLQIVPFSPAVEMAQSEQNVSPHLPALPMDVISHKSLFVLI